jgi:hypothetical protein
LFLLGLSHEYKKAAEIAVGLDGFVVAEEGFEPPTPGL